VLAAFRGLILGLVLSVLNLAGAFLTLLAFGGLGEWTGPQFLGCFGLLEVATGVAFIVCPNIWRLPVAEANTEVEVRLAASTLFIPHWAAGVKGVAGAILMGYAAASEGIGPGTALLAVEAALIVLSFAALSLVAARAGVARPDVDVVQFIVKRPGHPDRELPGASIGALIVQMLLNIGAFPAVKLLPPSILYRPDYAPAPGLLGWSAAAAAGLTAAAFMAWRGRFAWQAPREQQREAEEFA
jgi:hypothetical protein